MKREFRRIYRLYGIRYFALPVIVVLFLAAFLDHSLPGYLQHRAEATDVEATLESNAAVLSLGKRLQKNFDALNSDFDASKNLIFSNLDRTQSSRDFQNQVRQTLDSLYFDSIELQPVSEKINGNTIVMTTEARFTGVPQQLPRLETAIANSSKLLAVKQLEISVVEDTKRGGHQLLITAQFSGIHIPPVDASAAETLKQKN